MFDRGMKVLRQNETISVKAYREVVHAMAGEWKSRAYAENRPADRP